jgi:hypothetical protein
MKYNFLFAVALLFSIQATAQLNLFGGAGFEVSYPNTFRAVGSQRSPEKNGYESVFFTSPDGGVEFYIFSPINKGVPNDIDVKINEKISPIQLTSGKTVSAKFWTITAKDNSYTRAYHESIDSKTGSNWIVGIKYKSQAAYNKYKNDYLAFKKSFKKTNSNSNTQVNPVVKKISASFSYSVEDDEQTGGSTTNVFLNYNGKKFYVGKIYGTALKINSDDFENRDIPPAAITACMAFFGGTGTYYYLIQKGDKLVLYRGANSEEDPRIFWSKVKEY